MDKIKMKKQILNKKSIFGVHSQCCQSSIWQTLVSVILRTRVICCFLKSHQHVQLDSRKITNEQKPNNKNIKCK